MKQLCVTLRNLIGLSSPEKEITRNFPEGTLCYVDYDTTIELFTLDNWTIPVDFYYNDYTIMYLDISSECALVKLLD